MTTQDYSLAFTVDQTPEEAFKVINDVRSWWSGAVEGDTVKPGSEFSYRVDGVHYSKQKITESVPGKKVVWHVTEAKLDFVKDEDEWKGTDIVFEIAKKGAKTEVRFTHKAWSRRSSATRTARTPGACWSTATCAGGSSPASRSPARGDAAARRKREVAAPTVLKAEP